MSNDQLLAAVRNWTAANYPGCSFRYLVLHVDQLPVPIQLAEKPGQARAAPPTGREGEAVEPEEEDGPGERYSRCCGDILAVLEKAGVPLTTTRILSALSAAGKEWSERWVSKMLKRMIDDGTLENPKGVRPPGYRLPEWEERAERGKGSTS